MTRVCQNFSSVFERLKRDDGYENEALDNVCSNLRALSIVKYPPVGPVACLGPAGIGKSSMINSVLSQKLTAPEHDGDERGTYVVHEYPGPLCEQCSPYLVEIPYRSMQVIKTLCIRHQTTNPLPSDELDEEEEEAQKKYHTALEFFYDLLCDHPDFEDMDEVKSFFDNEMPFEEVTEQLYKRILCFVESCKLQEVHPCADEGEMNEIFQKVSRPVKTRKGRIPSPWPLITKVKVRQNLDLLRVG